MQCSPIAQVLRQAPRRFVGTERRDRKLSGSRRVCKELRKEAVGGFEADVAAVFFGREGAVRKPLTAGLGREVGLEVGSDADWGTRDDGGSGTTPSGVCAP